MRAGSKRNFAPYLMLIPWVIGFIVFKIYPILISFVYSLMEYPILGDPEFIGFDNYVHIFTNDDVFRSSIAATMKYVLIGTLEKSRMVQSMNTPNILIRQPNLLQPDGT